ncbi:MAG TPA: DUF6801 domain-containing protein [Actinokineospora sp.]|jgi:hypothetical protein|nr:DUF6801 domain-containing protein [Actinokineospora sp.]
MRLTKKKTAAAMVALTTAGAVATAMVLTAGSSAAAAALDLNYSCTFPLIDVQPVKVHINADIPDTIQAGVPTGAFNIEALSTLNEDTTTGLKLVKVATIEGTAVSHAHISAPGFDTDLDVPVTVEKTTVPASGGFTVKATGKTPSLTFPTPGHIKITVLDLELKITARKADGTLASIPPSNPFDAPCTQDPGQNNVLKEGEILPKPGPTTTTVTTTSTTTTTGPTATTTTTTTEPTTTTTTGPTTTTAPTTTTDPTTTTTDPTTTDPTTTTTDPTTTTTDPTTTTTEPSTTSSTTTTQPTTTSSTTEPTTTTSTTTSTTSTTGSSTTTPPSTTESTTVTPTATSTPPSTTDTTVPPDTTTTTTTVPPIQTVPAGYTPPGSDLADTGYPVAVPLTIGVLLLGLGGGVLLIVRRRARG